VALAEKARTAIGIEMRDSYARAVEKSLEGQFDVDDDENSTALSAAFRRMVMDTIAEGMKLQLSSFESLT
jgi:hypothetical protein